ncbi:MAG: hypothetical protein DMF75_03185, partial [Acidobacteria bacterium]
LKMNGKIAFMSGRNGFLDIYVMNADGSNQRQLTFGMVNPADGFSRTYTSEPLWSPDGSRIAFKSEFDFHGFNLYLMNADGTRIRKITNSGSVGFATWSPDGKRLAFSTTCFNFEGNPCETDIYTVNVDGSNLTKLIGSSDAAAYSPAWSSDGTKIAFVRESYDAPYPSIYVMNVDGSGETRLTFTSAAAFDRNPKWSPDGTKIAFIRFNDLYIMNADGSNQTAVTTGGQASEFGVAWSPDGTKLLIDKRSQISQNAYVVQIYSIDVDGTNKRNLSNSTSYDYVGDWQPLYISASNPIDDPQFFIRQHYDDFLSREPDPSGYAFWTNEIMSCGSDAKCIDTKRQNVSAAYFLSTEFQETGYLVYRFYNAALNRTNRLPRFIEFMRDTQRVGDGVIVNATGWQQQLEQNKQAFAQEFVTRPEFKTLYPDAMSPAQFVDALYQHAGITPSSTERQVALDEFNTPTGARGRVMRRVAENQTVFTREFNRAFVLMQYFGYLRRNPDDPPDNNVSGYNFWLGKLNQFGGNYQAAEMVKAFLVSSEYRQRFGP